MTLSNIAGDGNLSILVPYNTFEDLATNVNQQEEFNIVLESAEQVTQVIIDNTVPKFENDDLILTLDEFESDRFYPDLVMSTSHDDWSKEDIYVQINATDSEEIGYWMKSTNGTDYVDMGKSSEVLGNQLNTNVYYKVVDKAGNESDVISRKIKIDKIEPKKPVILLTEQRKSGALYSYNHLKPIYKTIHVNVDASTVVDQSIIQSGVVLDETKTYYTVTKYTDYKKTTMVGTTLTYAYNQEAILNSNGYYEIQMIVTDLAGNQNKSDLYQVYIQKIAENTIRVTNLNDIGSGVKKVTIRIYRQGASELATEEIIVENPYGEIVKNVNLGDGKFDVIAIIEDKVGNTKELRNEIENHI